MDGQDSKSPAKKGEEAFYQAKTNRQSQTQEAILKNQVPGPKEERQASWKYVENIIELGDSDQEQQPSKQKRFFSFIKSLKRDSSGIAPLRDQGKLHSDPADKANK